MKKRILKIGVLFSFIALATIGVKIANNNRISSVRSMFLNMEALAADPEVGSRYNICYYTSTVRKGKTYYDCTDCPKKIYDEKETGTYTKCFY